MDNDTVRCLTSWERREIARARVGFFMEIQPAVPQRQPTLVEPAYSQHITGSVQVVSLTPLVTWASDYPASILASFLGG